MTSHSIQSTHPIQRSSGSKAERPEREPQLEEYSWYAARTGYGQEVGIKHRLEALGMEHFIPTEKRRGYRGRICESALLHNLVFVYATKREACELRTLIGLPLRYLFDYASRSMLTVPLKQMEDFRRVFEYSLTEGGLTDQPLEAGECVKVVRGPLRGVEGNVMELQGRLYVVVSLCGMAYARARIARSCLERKWQANHRNDKIRKRPNEIALPVSPCPPVAGDGD